jgi:hypothetical protein
MIDEAIRTVKQNYPGYSMDEGLDHRKGEAGLPPLSRDTYLGFPFGSLG